ncbi:hypothetical protein DOS77_09035 [Staphylococcus felis]|uniref:Uncharacterized protein n=1 Tax=Staphylococcus felis TaxID=46127 RepID=A0AAX1RVH0_9STAP|nr:hypothetical protein DOS59_08715 [Staphylococcus felis]REH85313.1 hypothetical protein DOS63_05575 [Staphylococcus felis]REH86525.1 hypothetical protein DOS56_00185 [Staphylococcus felis]REH98993.1 hypothetical protein DOS64_09970 [Staphylococcus felis]REI13687.1 hypothetical protein DOS74_10860 [Staphylococcus felis]
MIGNILLRVIFIILILALVINLLVVFRLVEFDGYWYGWFNIFNILLLGIYFYYVNKKIK